MIAVSVFWWMKRISAKTTAPATSTTIIITIEITAVAAVAVVEAALRAITTR